MASAASVGPLVSVEWLKENLHRPDVRVLDATWFLSPMGTFPLTLILFPTG
jgi:3-mercaptopyruvate sulfurtransferase SseA